MAKGIKTGGRTAKGVAVKDSQMKVNPIDKPVIREFIDLLDDPTTRAIALDLLEAAKGAKQPHD